MGQRVGAASLTTKRNTRKVKIRGEVYELTELTIGEYDEIVEKSKVKRANPISGIEEDATDNQVVLTRMVAKSTGLSLSKLDDLAMPVKLTLNALVNDMHFPPTDAGSKGILWEAVDSDEDEGEGKEETPGEG